MLRMQPMVVFIIKVCSIRGVLGLRLTPIPSKMVTAISGETFTPGKFWIGGLNSCDNYEVCFPSAGPSSTFVAEGRKGSEVFILNSKEKQLSLCLQRTKGILSIFAILPSGMAQTGLQNSWKEVVWHFDNTGTFGTKLTGFSNLMA